MERPLIGKTALVTGSTSGLGRTLAEALAAAGSHVILTGFGEASEIEALRAGLETAHGVRARYIAADLTAPADIVRLMAEAGAIDILVNNAGMQFVSPLESFPGEKWDAILALNLSAAFHTTKAALPAMRARKWGRIVNIASAHGLVASPFKAAYVASKHGLVGLTKTTALETARDGVTCNALCPGFIHTAIVEGQIEEQSRATGIPRERVVEEIILAKHATKEFVRADQVAAFVLFLCSEAGASTTGSALPIDGGWTAA
ncbi:3-hydroxybutyrate dehydrogenase [Verrucomicrobium sp. GAS474]|uniref:3-hydroxybutyrate dehydrogenase n=1 Tax=Verrucomicrobium sp. GAS474 TaxID=1882831 RepID=UPI00087CF56C|nr:3-hydroxybutyrate dehydrogenase [Verrucomicrobium sp. GAS474]SDU29572.1 3-hydroxybutyrate dehydrogenase [Verrucomicrobium sp. GAS474]